MGMCTLCGHSGFS